MLLLIEDNPADAALVEGLVAEDGIELVSASTGREGIEHARDDAPDIVLLDLGLPDMNGREVLRALREDPATADLPVVVVTADASSASEQELREAGASGFETKPIDLRRVVG